MADASPTDERVFAGVELGGTKGIALVWREGRIVDRVQVPTTDPQTTLPRQARLNNLRKAFDVRRPQDLKEKRILLVDDVFTTGTTLNECAKALRQAGSGPVFALTLARTVDAALVPDRLWAEQGIPAHTHIGL